MRHGESQSQRALLKWWDHAHKGLGVRDRRQLVAIPNAGKRGPMLGALMKAEGLRAGFPDLMLLQPASGHAGLFIELKVQAGRTTREQEEYIALLKSAGYAATVARGFEQAQKAITDYLAGLWRNAA